MREPELYYFPMSAPCRAVLLTAEAIGLSLNLKFIDLLAGQHLKAEFEQRKRVQIIYEDMLHVAYTVAHSLMVLFLQLNPRKTIPLLVDGNYKLTESRAIMSYLVDQYGKNERLNPQNPVARALINHRLYFDIGTLYRSMAAYYYPVYFHGAEAFNPEEYEKLKAAFEIFDKILDGHDYAVGRNLTIADLALVTTVCTVEIFGFDVSEYKHVAKWFEKIKSSAPGYRKVNDEGLKMLKKLVEDVNSR